MIKKFLFMFLLLWIGITTGLAQDYAVGNTYSDVLHLSHSQTIEGVTKNYPYTLEYSITYLEGGKLHIEADLQWDSEVALGAIDLMYVDGPGGEISMNRTKGEADSRESMSLGESFTLVFRIPAYGGDVVRTEVPYIAGSKSRPSLGLTAEVRDITMDKAYIYYEVTKPEEYKDATVTVTLDGKTVSESPIVLTELSANTLYNYELTATATLFDKETLSKSIPVSFSTERDPSVPMHNYQIANGFLSNAYYDGEDPTTSRRNIPITYKSDIEYNTDNTLTINFTIMTRNNIAGLVQEVVIDDYSGAIGPENGVYTKKFSKTYSLGDRILPWFHPQFEGGDARIELPWLTIGDTNKEVNYGEPIGVRLYSDLTDITANVPQWFCAYLVDENENFILNEKPTLSIENNTVEVDITGDFITLAGKGEATLVAEYNGQRAEQVFRVLQSDDTDNLALGIIPSTCDDASDHKKATDGINNDDKNYMLFPCKETEDHYFTLDLGGLKDIELIKLVWEGASAKKYTVTLKDEDGKETVIFTETDGEGGGGVIVNKNIEDINKIARYVTVHITEAFEPAWNIKLMEIEVHGREYTPLDWTNIPADNNSHSYSEKNVVAIYSNVYRKTDLPSFTAQNATIEHLTTAAPTQRNVKPYAEGEDDSESDDANKVILFKNMKIEENAIINLNEDVKGATLFCMDVYSQTPGTITLSAVWDYKGVTEDTSDKTYSFNISSDQVNQWIPVSFEANRIGYGVTSTQYNSPITTITKLIINSNIPEFAVDNCYFAGSSALAVEAVEAEADGAAVYYNLQGVKVDNPDRGIFIKVQNGKAVKVVK